MAIVDAETMALFLSLRVDELINQLHRLCQVATHMTHHLEKLILIKVRWHPESYVFVTSWEFGIGLKLGDLALFELSYKSRVLTPEESDVLNVE